MSVKLASAHLATQMHDLLDCAAAGQVGHGPGCLLLGLEISLDEDVDQRLEAARVNHQLDLSVVTRRDVGDGPGALLKFLKVVNLRNTNYNCTLILLIYKDLLRSPHINCKFQGSASRQGLHIRASVNF